MLEPAGDELGAPAVGLADLHASAVADGGAEGALLLDPVPQNDAVSHMDTVPHALPQAEALGLGNAERESSSDIAAEALAAGEEVVVEVAEAHAELEGDGELEVERCADALEMADLVEVAEPSPPVAVAAGLPEREPTPLAEGDRLHLGEEVEEGHAESLAAVDAEPEREALSVALALSDACADEEALVEAGRVGVASRELSAEADTEPVARIVSDRRAVTDGEPVARIDNDGGEEAVTVVAAVDDTEPDCEAEAQGESRGDSEALPEAGADAGAVLEPVAPEETVRAGLLLGGAEPVVQLLRDAELEAQPRGERVADALPRALALLDARAVALALRKGEPDRDAPLGLSAALPVALNEGDPEALLLPDAQADARELLDSLGDAEGDLLSAAEALGRADAELAKVALPSAEGVASALREAERQGLAVGVAGAVPLAEALEEAVRALLPVGVAVGRDADGDPVALGEGGTVGVPLERAVAAALKDAGREGVGQGDAVALPLLLALLLALAVVDSALEALGEPVGSAEKEGEPVAEGEGVPPAESEADVLAAPEGLAQLLGVALALSRAVGLEVVLAVPEGLGPRVGEALGEGESVTDAEPEGRADAVARLGVALPLAPPLPEELALGEGLLEAAAERDAEAEALPVPVAAPERVGLSEPEGEARALAQAVTVRRAEEVPEAEAEVHAVGLALPEADTVGVPVMHAVREGVPEGVAVGCEAVGQALAVAQVVGVLVGEPEDDAVGAPVARGVAVAGADQLGEGVLQALALPEGVALGEADALGEPVTEMEKEGELLLLRVARDRVAEGVPVGRGVPEGGGEVVTVGLLEDEGAEEGELRAEAEGWGPLGEALLVGEGLRVPPAVPEAVELALSVAVRGAEGLGEAVLLKVAAEVSVGRALCVTLPDMELVGVGRGERDSTGVREGVLEVEPVEERHREGVEVMERALEGDALEERQSVAVAVCEPEEQALPEGDPDVERVAKDAVKFELRDMEGVKEREDRMERVGARDTEGRDDFDPGALDFAEGVGPCDGESAPPTTVRTTTLAGA